jgi:acetyl-CoA synthetase
MSDPFEFGGEIVWKPEPETITRANLTSFMQAHNIQEFSELMQRSTEEIAWFTDAILDFLNIEFYQPYSDVLDLLDGIAWPHWCINGKMNIVHNCLDKYMGSPVENQAAFIWEAEEGHSQTITYRELYEKVNQAANALRNLGIEKGDAVGIYMPMIPEIIVAVLAVAKIGGIILPLFSGYGVSAVVTRLADADAKAIFTADGFFRRGKAIDMKHVADEAAQQVSSLKHMIVVNRANLPVSMIKDRDHWWHELVGKQPTMAPTEKTSAEDTLMVIYTSGTTGRPKGAVHTHCGFPIKAAQDMAFGTDVHPGEVIYWLTDMGWMMGPWLVFGALILRATFLIYDGAPDYPGPDRLWEIVEKYHVTTLGVSPTLIRALIPFGEEQFRKHDLSSIRYFASTGEPWNPDPWMWLFEKVGEGRRPIINYSGGTEISGGIVMGNPLLPLKPCAFSAPCPGIAADVFDEHGHSVRNQVGELVIKAPWIGMTRGFWHDPDRYLDTYWSRWPGVWIHGDFAAIDQDGLWYILGRSDDTIKVAGKRLGPAEVESILVHHPAVVEAAAIGIPHPIKGSELVVFCVLAPEYEPTPQLSTTLREMVTEAMGKSLAPKEVLFVADLPKTRNAKVMRRMIRSAYLGENPGDTSALVNPEAVAAIRKAR